jgi:site-specific recombinase XerD
MATNMTAIVPYDPTGDAPVQASSDDQMIALWLGRYRSKMTLSAFRNDVEHFRRAVPKPLREVVLRDIQAWGLAMEAIHKPASVGRRVSAVRSLFGFAHKIGYLQWNVAAAVTTPPIEDKLSQRILTEDQVGKLLAVLRNKRDGTLLRLLYIGGLRISEASGLRWRHVTPRDNGEAQLEVFGKGSRSRPVLIPAFMAEQLFALKLRTDGPDDPVFRSRSVASRGVSMGPRDIWKICKLAVQRANLPREISSHWLRHAHASHSLDRGAPVHVVQATLGHASLTTTTRYTHVRPGDSSAKYLPR